MSAILKCPMITETGRMTLAANITMQIWFKVAPSIRNEEEVQQYGNCVNEMYQLVCETDDKTLYTWWMHFWSIIAVKYPNATLDYIPQFLHDSIDRHQTMLAMFLPVRSRKRRDFYRIFRFLYR